MPNKTKNRNCSSVDKSLVALFVKMSAEERLQMNDNSVGTILELRNAYNQQKFYRHRTNLNTRRNITSIERKDGLGSIIPLKQP